MLIVLPFLILYLEVQDKFFPYHCVLVHQPNISSIYMYFSVLSISLKHFNNFCFIQVIYFLNFTYLSLHFPFLVNLLSSNLIGAKRPRLIFQSVRMYVCPIVQLVAKRLSLLFLPLVSHQQHR